MSGNKFLEDLIQVYAEEAEVDTLKTLREMDSNWNKLAIKELEKRSEQDQLKQLDFSKKGFQADLGRFLKNTRGNPQLFHSFRFYFPESFKFIDLTFFAIYKPMFLYLKINENFKFTDRATQYLVNFFTWIAPTLEKLIVKRGYASESVPKQVLPYSLPAHSGHLVFPKLTTCTLEVENKDNFQFILDKSGAVDPTPNLTSLSLYNSDGTDLVNFIGLLNSNALARWSQLINLAIHFYEEMKRNDILTDSLVSMSHAGMSLKMLKLDTCHPSDWIQSEKMNDFCSNLSHFLEMQSKSLQFLELGCVFKTNAHPTEEMTRLKIRLPIFENVHTLCFALSYEATDNEGSHRRLFEMGPLQVHFPKLEHLEICKNEFLAMYPSNGVPVEPIPLKSLDVHGEMDNLDEWSLKFTSLDRLTCEGSFANADMPWKESLKELEIFNPEYPVNVSHLTNLRKLIVDLDDHPIREDFLNNFDQVRTLKLSGIIFKSCKKLSDEIKAQFIRHFPFPVNFQLKDKLNSEFPQLNYLG